MLKQLALGMVTFMMTFPPARLLAAELKDYTNPDYFFQFKHLDNWTVLEQPGNDELSLTLVSPQSSHIVRVEALRMPSDEKEISLERLPVLMDKPSDSLGIAITTTYHSETFPVPHEYIIKTYRDTANRLVKAYYCKERNYYYRIVEHGMAESDFERFDALVPTFKSYVPFTRLLQSPFAQQLLMVIFFGSVIISSVAVYHFCSHVAQLIEVVASQDFKAIATDAKAAYFRKSLVVLVQYLLIIAVVIGINCYLLHFTHLEIFLSAWLGAVMCSAVPKKQYGALGMPQGEEDTGA